MSSANEGPKMVNFFKKFRNSKFHYHMINALDLVQNKPSIGAAVLESPLNFGGKIVSNFN